MARATIDYGIDLGTTNSAVAQLSGTDVRVFKSYTQRDTTPSAVYLDPRGRLRVGEDAKDKLVDDEGNAFSEFKLNMGKDHPYSFARDGRTLGPADLSAEVLKEMRRLVLHQTGEDIEAAVITVPAAFNLSQSNATKEAAKAAGLAYHPLLQEPVAAAQAYGFDDESDGVYWLVYDFGGGTFDAAVVRVHEGLIEVANHEGDNDLGGKKIDWDLIDTVLLPAMKREFDLPDIGRGGGRWNMAMAKLKNAAEDAKIMLSRWPSVDVEISGFEDAGGREVDFYYELKRADLARVAAPYIARSLNLCRKALTDARLGTGDIDRVLLVGGTTFMPAVREALEDPHKGLGIPLEFGIDPITVVARGAAIFAGMQRVPEGSHKVRAGQYRLELEYEPAGSDTDPPIGGLVLGEGGDDLSGFTIEFFNPAAHPPWRSGKVALDPGGFFQTTLWAEKGRQSTYEVELLDPTGRPRETVPDAISYTCVVGSVQRGAPLTDNVGVAMANNEVDVVFEKGTKLEPKARRRIIHETAYPLTAGAEGEAIRIPLIEGPYPKANRNRKIGELRIPASDIVRDLPEGSEVEITVEIDSSRLVRASALVTDLDQEFDEVLDFDSTVRRTQGELAEDVSDEKERLARVREQVAATGDPAARQILEAMEAEDLVPRIDRSIAVCDVDPEAVDACDTALRQLKATLDEVEGVLKWPALAAEADVAAAEAREIVEASGGGDAGRRLADLEAELERAQATQNVDLLRNAVNELRALRYALLREDPGFVVGLFHALSEMRDEMRDRALADRAISSGQHALEVDDLDGLQVAVNHLLGLLPAGHRDAVDPSVGGTRRRR